MTASITARTGVVSIRMTSNASLTPSIIFFILSEFKIGGIIAGHDYKDGPKSGISDYFGKQLNYHIKTVVDYYGQRYGYKIHPFYYRPLVQILESKNILH